VRETEENATELVIEEKKETWTERARENCHKTDQTGVNENGKLPMQNTTERTRDIIMSMT